jgi:hypothetical protein
MKLCIIFATIITISHAIGDSIIVRSKDRLRDNIGHTLEFGVNDMPQSMDWRQKGVILPVQTQVLTL